MTETPDMCVIVTGAGGSLGQAVVEQARSQGPLLSTLAIYRRSNPIDADSNPESLVSLANVDLATDEGVQRLRSAVETNSAPRKVLVHCAGRFPAVRPLHQTPLHE